MAVINSPFESKYGFKGPGFSVDDAGNIIANSIITSTTPGDDTDTDFIDFNVTVDNNSFAIEGYTGGNPSITLARQQTYTFAIDAPILKFNILTGNAFDSPFYNIGLSHSDGTTGEDAQNKISGSLRFSVPLNAPNTLYYADEIRNNFGVINIVDPTGRFGTVDINSTVNSTSPTTGALTIAGGAGIEQDLFIGGSLNVGGTGITNLSSGNNLELEAVNEIILKVDGNKIGVVNENGFSTTIINSTINNTTIGNTTPSTAVFTEAQVQQSPASANSITNKTYVDSTALSLSIAFGL